MFFILTAGLALWIVAHVFKRVAPEARASLGDAGRGIVTAALVVSLGLMIWGYRGTDFIHVWAPPAFMVHINNLLMLIAVFLFGLSATTGSLRGKMRHPQLTSVMVWAVAHLLVNGDLASILLFGTLLIWAVLEVVLINRAEEWQRPEPGDPKRNVILFAITIVVFVVVTALHAWLGVWPFPG